MRGSVRSVGSVRTVQVAANWLVIPFTACYPFIMMPYERIKAWEKCHLLALAVYRATKRWPKEETYGLISQARRAAFGAAANIVEGAARRGPREFRRFLDISISSLNELAYALRFANDLDLCTRDQYQELESLREPASKLTWRLYEAIKKKSLR